VGSCNSDTTCCESSRGFRLPLLSHPPLQLLPAPSVPIRRLGHIITRVAQRHGAIFLLPDGGDTSDTCRSPRSLPVRPGGVAHDDFKTPVVTAEYRFAAVVHIHLLKWALTSQGSGSVTCRAPGTFLERFCNQAWRASPEAWFPEGLSRQLEGLVRPGCFPPERRDYCIRCGA